MISENVVVAIIALVGVLLSTVISLLVSRYQLRQQARALRESYTQELFRKRLEYYPLLFNEIRKFGQLVWHNEVTKQSIEAFSQQVDSWESNYSIFLSPTSIRQLIRLRFTLRNLIKEAEFSKRKLNRELKMVMFEMEMSLRNELGVFDALEFHRPTQTTDLRSEIDKLDDI